MPRRAFSEQMKEKSGGMVVPPPLSSPQARHDLERFTPHKRPARSKTITTITISPSPPLG